jgi:hypothetical protein
MNDRRGDQVPDQALFVAQRAEERQRQHNRLVSRLASQWAEGLTKVFGVASAVGLVGAPFAADKLDAGSRRVVGGLLLGMLVTAIVGLWSVMSAAYGNTRRAPVTTTEAQGREIEALQAKHGLRRFEQGRALTLASLLLLAAAVGWSWAMSSPASDARQLVRLTTSSGAEHCGELVPSVDEHVGLRIDGDHVVDFRNESVVALTTTKDC